MSSSFNDVIKNVDRICLEMMNEKAILKLSGCQESILALRNILKQKMIWRGEKHENKKG